MNKALTATVWGCILGVLILPSFSVLTQAMGLLSLSAATVAVLLMTVVGALAAWRRTVASGNLNALLPNEAEAAYRSAQSFIFPELRWLGWKAPKIVQSQWDECSGAPKSVATLLNMSRIQLLPLAVLIIFLLVIALEHGVLHSLKQQSSLKRLWPFWGSPIANALKISFVCFFALTVLHLLLCKISAQEIKEGPGSDS